MANSTAIPVNKSSVAHQIDAAVSLDDLKQRLRRILIDFETRFATQNNIKFVDANTDNDPAQYKAGDIIIDSSIIPNALVLYVIDIHKNKITQTLQSFAGNLPLSDNEIFIGDGSTKNFNTQDTFNPGSTHVYVAGLRQRIGLSGTYVENTVTNKQIQFASAPAAAAVIIVDYQLASIL